MGEAVTSAVVPAVTNAVFAATGKKISNSESCNILAHLVGRNSTIRRIASRHYSAEGLLRMCRRPQRANLMRPQAAFASK
jgi:hypothetical protein